MKRIGKTSWKRLAPAFAAAALLFAVTGQQASAQQTSAPRPTVDLCQTAFEGSPADAYCPNRSYWIRLNDDGERSCGIHTDCSITVRVGETDKTFRNGLASMRPFSLAETRSLDLCFSRHGEESNTNINRHDGWRMDVNPGCGDAIDSATAKADGLSLDGS